MFKTRSVAVVMMMLSVGLLGCGKGLNKKAAQASEKGETPSGNLLSGDSLKALATSIQVRWVGSRPGEAAKPDEKASFTEYPSEALKEQIVFQKVLYLARSGAETPEFLVFNSETSQGTVRAAFYTFRRLGARGEEKRASTQWKKVEQMPENGLFYIRQAEAVGGELEQVDVSDTQLLRIQLLLSTGVLQDFEVAFKALGALPDVVVQAGGLPEFSASTTQLGRRAAAGIVLKREFIKNPSKRALTLWAHSDRSTSGRGLSYVTGLRQDGKRPRYITNGLNTTPILEADINHYQSSFALTLGSIRVFRKTGEDAKKAAIYGDGQTLALGGLEWAKISVPPQSELLIDWIAKAESPPATCLVPAERMVRVDYVVRSGGCDHGVQCGIIERPAFVEGRESWSLIGSGIYGKWWRELRLTDSSMTSNEIGKILPGDLISQNPRIRSLAPWSEQDSGNPVIGESIREDLPHHSCHGLF